MNFKLFKLCHHMCSPPTLSLLSLLSVSAMLHLMKQQHTHTYRKINHKRPFAAGCSWLLGGGSFLSSAAVSDESSYLTAVFPSSFPHRRQRSINAVGPYAHRLDTPDCAVWGMAVRRSRRE